jgi:AraC-like DNA-binding protein
MSHSIVYKKLKALTGYNLVEFIRDYRLKKAAQLLTSGEVSVKEACFAVGFSDRKYFGAMFKKKFGTNPSDYRKDPQRKTDITRKP